MNSGLNMSLEIQFVLFTKGSCSCHPDRWWPGQGQLSQVFQSLDRPVQPDGTATPAALFLSSSVAFWVPPRPVPSLPVISPWSLEELSL